MNAKILAFNCLFEAPAFPFSWKVGPDGALILLLPLQQSPSTLGPHILWHNTEPFSLKKIYGLCTSVECKTKIILFA